MPEESTTPDLVELWQQANKAFNERDLDAVMRFWAPDAVLDVTRTLGIAERGRAAYAACTRTGLLLMRS
jgi:ketosteroid isomerase-like protein